MEIIEIDAGSYKECTRRGATVIRVTTEQEAKEALKAKDAEFEDEMDRIIKQVRVTKKLLCKRPGDRLKTCDICINCKELDDLLGEILYPPSKEAKPNYTLTDKQSKGLSKELQRKHCGKEAKDQ